MKMKRSKKWIGSADKLRIRWDAADSSSIEYSTAADKNFVAMSRRVGYYWKKVECLPGFKKAFTD